MDDQSKTLSNEYDDAYIIEHCFSNTEENDTSTNTDNVYNGKVNFRIPDCPIKCGVSNCFWIYLEKSALMWGGMFSRGAGGCLGQILGLERAVRFVQPGRRGKLSYPLTSHFTDRPRSAFTPTNPPSFFFKPPSSIQSSCLISSSEFTSL